MATLDVGAMVATTNALQPMVMMSQAKARSEFAVMSLLNEFVIKTAYLVGKAYVKKLKFSSC